MLPLAQALMLAPLGAAVPLPAVPTEPFDSCWHFLPNGCPCGAGSICAREGGEKQRFWNKWQRDIWDPRGEPKTPGACARKVTQKNGWCGVDDTVWYFVSALQPCARHSLTTCRPHLHS